MGIVKGQTEKFGGVDRLETLQSHADDVVHLNYHAMQDYFS